jgi:hypothetical protein
LAAEEQLALEEGAVEGADGQHGAA